MNKQELVTYDNTLNTLQFKGFRPMDYNVLMVLCHKLGEKGTKRLVFSFDELKELIAFENQSDQLFAKDLDRMVKQLLEVNATHINGNVKTYFVLFPTFKIDDKKKTLTVSVNPEFTYILNELSSNFTQFELREFVELDSKYTKSLYRIFKQYKYSGWWNPTVEQLRTVLDIPENYTNKRIMGDVLKPALKVLEQKFEDLKCEPIKAKKKGAPIEKYYFTWRALGQTKGQTNIVDADRELSKQKDKRKKAPKNKFNNIESSPSYPKTHEEWDTFEKSMIDN